MESRLSRRLRIQIYLDTLTAIHAAWKNEKRPSKYHLERTVGLPHSRLAQVIGELENVGLVDAQLNITTKGYDFMHEISSKVEPILREFGFWKD